MPLIRSHSTQHGADGCVAIVSSPVTTPQAPSSPLPRSVFLSRTVSSPLLDSLWPLTTVVKGRAAQTEHGTQTQTRDRHSHQWRVTRFPTDTTNPTLSVCIPVAQNREREREPRTAQLSSAQHIQHTHSAHPARSPELALALISALSSTADTSEPARPVHQCESE